jgi:hypothetical protein
VSLIEGTVAVPEGLADCTKGSGQEQQRGQDVRALVGEEEMSRLWRLLSGKSTLPGHLNSERVEYSGWFAGLSTDSLGPG